MLTLNVSFGLFALLSPLSWAYDMVVLVLESYLASRMLLKVGYDLQVYATICLSNVVSGLVGLGLSLMLTGGWIIAIWLPYVGPKEISGPPLGPWGNFAMWYLLAFFLSVGIEFLINRLCLRRRFDRRSVWRMTLRVNIVSYLLGTLFVYSISFGSYLLR